MEEVRVVEKRLSDYRAIIGGPAFAEILALASKLKGKRVAHVNATGYGGGGAAPPPPPPPPPRGGGPPLPWFAPPPANALFPAAQTPPTTRPRAHPGLPP